MAPADNLAYGAYVLQKTLDNQKGGGLFERIESPARSRVGKFCLVRIKATGPPFICRAKRQAPIIWSPWARQAVAQHPRHIKTLEERLSACPVEGFIPTPLNPKNAGVIIFTSGTTSAPTGIEVL